MKKVISLLLSVVLLLGVAVPAFAADGDEELTAYEEALAKVVEYYAGEDVELDDWDAMALLALGEELDYELPDEEDVLGSESVNTYAKAILLAAAMGENPRMAYGAGYDKDLVRNLALMQNDDGSFGDYLNETIYAIIALENTDANAYDRETAIAALLEMQLEDGGFVYFIDEENEQSGDVDLTGMALVAISCFVMPGSPVEVAEPIEAAVAFLKNAINENGVYSSPYTEGSEPSESVSCALWGLVAADVDIEEDEAFAALAENLLGYQLENGGFASENDDDEAGVFATYQALYALCGLVEGESVFGRFSYDASGAESMFADVEDIDSALDTSIAYLYNSGIIVGHPGALICLDDEITVAQMAVVLDKTLNPGAEYEGVWYASAMARLIEDEILDADADPFATVTFEMLDMVFGTETEDDGVATRGDAFAACVQYILENA